MITNYLKRIGMATSPRLVRAQLAMLDVNQWHGLNTSLSNQSNFFNLALVQRTLQQTDDECDHNTAHL